jgi:hypothetical protein
MMRVLRQLIELIAPVNVPARPDDRIAHGGDRRTCATGAPALGKRCAFGPPAGY